MPRSGSRVRVSFAALLKRNIHSIIFMNLYLRYFDNEVLVHSVDEALDFLSSIPDIQLTPEWKIDIRIMLLMMFSILSVIRCAHVFILL